MKRKASDFTPVGGVKSDAFLCLLITEIIEESTIASSLEVGGDEGADFFHSFRRGILYFMTEVHVALVL